MKKKVVKKSVKQNIVVKKSKTWIWIVLAFLFGAMFGFALNYTISNWSSFFTEPLLCEDGQKPDSNGCCAGEVYTDAGGGWMVCCPDGGDNCFPPMK